MLESATKTEFQKQANNAMLLMQIMHFFHARLMREFNKI